MGTEGRVAATPSIDISVVVYNAAPSLSGFVGSLARGRFPAARVRLLLRDHGSSDGSREQLEKLAREYRPAFAGIEVYSDTNVGFGRGQNRNLERARGDWFLVLNPDTELAPDALADAVEYALADAADSVAWEFRQVPFEHPKVYDPVTLETGWVSGACCLFRPTALRGVGGFDPGFFLYGEDVDLSWRLRAAGFRLRYLPFARCRHDRGPADLRVKPAQALGAIRAAILLRARFGRLSEIVWTPIPVLAAVLRGGPGLSRLQLAAEALASLRHWPRFLATRSAFRGRFQWFGLNYGLRRPGALVPAPEPRENPPRASIVIRTTRDGAGRLAEALWSVINQTWPTVEVVVVEDGSEESRALCQSVDGIAGRRVRYLGLPASGRSRAGNAGLAATGGEFIGFLDDDDLLYADHVECLACALAAAPGAAAAWALAFEQPVRVESQRPWRIRAGRQRLAWRTPFSSALLQYANFLPIQSVLFRRSTWEAAGGLDESLDRLEDWDLWARYALVGDFVGVDRVTSVYRTPADPVTRRRREAALRTIRSERVQVNLKRCREAARGDLAREVAVLAGRERGSWRFRAGIEWILARLPGGSALYECLLLLRRRRLARRARELNARRSGREDGL